MLPISGRLVQGLSTGVGQFKVATTATHAPIHEAPVDQLLNLFTTTRTKLPSQRPASHHTGQQETAGSVHLVERSAFYRKRQPSSSP